MKHYIPKGTCVKAIQWNGSNNKEILEFVNSNISECNGVSKALTDYYFRYKYYYTAINNTLVLTRYANDYPTPYEETTTVYPYDYVVMSKNGSIKVWKPGLFEDQYEDINFAGDIVIDTVSGVQWKGDNIDEVKEFVNDPEVEVHVMRFTKWLTVCSRDEGFVIGIGDFLTKDKQGYLGRATNKKEGE